MKFSYRNYLIILGNNCFLLFSGWKAILNRVLGRFFISTLVLLALVMLPRFGAAASLYDSNKKGMEAYAKGEFEKALDHFTRAQLEAPEKPEVFYNLANTRYKLGDYESACNNYKKALTTEKKDLKQRIHFNLGNAAFRMGKHQEAIDAYKKALEIDPRDLSAKKNMEFVKKVMEEEKQKQQKNGDDKKDNKSGDQKEKGRNGSEKKENPDDKKEKGENPEDRSGSRKEDENRKKEGQSSESDKQKQDNSGPGAKKDSPQEEKQGGGKMEQAGAHDEKRDKDQAERMLNRLKDMPGRAMMPSYKPHQVEQDW